MGPGGELGEAGNGHGLVFIAPGAEQVGALVAVHGGEEGDVVAEGEGDGAGAEGEGEGGEEEGGVVVFGECREELEFLDADGFAARGEVAADGWDGEEGRMAGLEGVGAEGSGALVHAFDVAGGHVVLDFLLDDVHELEFGELEGWGAGADPAGYFDDSLCGGEYFAHDALAVPVGGGSVLKAGIDVLGVEIV